MSRKDHNAGELRKPSSVSPAPKRRRRAQIAARHALEIRVEGRSEERLPGPIETVLYRIVQEALTNVARHAQARHVQLRLASGASSDE